MQYSSMLVLVEKVKNPGQYNAIYETIELLLNKLSNHFNAFAVFTRYSNNKSFNEVYVTSYEYHILYLILNDIHLLSELK